VSQYQKGKTNLDLTEARDSEWQWHQLGHMQVCTSLQADNHASTPPLKFFTGRMPFLSPNQQRQSTEGAAMTDTKLIIYYSQPPICHKVNTTTADALYLQHFFVYAVVCIRLKVKHIRWASLSSWL